jgi:hypothetical protein
MSEEEVTEGTYAFDVVSGLAEAGVDIVSKRKTTAKRAAYAVAGYINRLLTVMQGRTGLYPVLVEDSWKPGIVMPVVGAAVMYGIAVQGVRLSADEARAIPILDREGRSREHDLLYDILRGCPADGLPAPRLEVEEAFINLYFRTNPARRGNWPMVHDRSRLGVARWAVNWMYRFGARPGFETGVGSAISRVWGKQFSIPFVSRVRCFGESTIWLFDSEKAQYFARLSLVR